MAKKEYVEINGRRFEKVDRNITLQQMAYYNANGTRDLYDVYNHPSREKVNIFNDWKEWARETPNVGLFGISPKNCSKQCMTLTAITHFDGVRAVLVMTKAHNYCYVVKNLWSR